MTVEFEMCWYIDLQLPVRAFRFLRNYSVSQSLSLPTLSHLHIVSETNLTIDECASAVVLSHFVRCVCFLNSLFCDGCVCRSVFDQKFLFQRFDNMQVASFV